VKLVELPSSFALDPQASPDYAFCTFSLFILASKILPTYRQLVVDILVACAISPIIQNAVIMRLQISLRRKWKIYAAERYEIDGEPIIAITQ
jgi:hypothetical protein